MAYLLRTDQLSYLRQAGSESDEQTRADIEAAIDAIENQNHHYFVDRDHSGLTTLNIG